VEPEKGRQRKKTVIWFVWFLSFVWLNETNQMNQINQINKTNQSKHPASTAAKLPFLGESRASC
jgi:hypothetical protein